MEKTERRLDSYCNWPELARLASMYEIYRPALRVRVTKLPQTGGDCGATQMDFDMQMWAT